MTDKAQLCGWSRNSQEQVNKAQLRMSSLPSLIPP